MKTPSESGIQKRENLKSIQSNFRKPPHVGSIHSRGSWTELFWGMTYSEKLRDPRWQRKRLEVLQAADFKCEFCGDGTQTLHVHHLKYTGEPWEAPLKDLECLCEYHHEQREQMGGIIMEVIVSKSRASRAAHLLRVMNRRFDAGMTDSLERMIASLE